MKIKEIEAMYAHYDGIRNARFVSSDFGGEIGKVVIVIEYDKVGGYIWRDVAQVVRVSDGVGLLTEGRRRPCDNLKDSIDVAWDMLTDDQQYR